jgi:hypothetical protein
MNFLADHFSIPATIEIRKRNAPEPVSGAFLCLNSEGVKTTDDLYRTGLTSLFSMRDP